MEWRMTYAHHDAFRKWEENQDNCAYTIDNLNSGALPVIAAKVPGNFELDMMREGLLEDLYFSTNTLKAQELEDMHLCYFTTVTICKPEQYLCFEGIDTYADIYVNGQLVKSTDNMFLAYDVDADWKMGENEVVVHIKPAMLEARKYASPAVCRHLKYNQASLYTRKASHMYGWDIMPRIVSAGIWKEVRLCEHKQDVLDEIYLTTMQTTPDEKNPDYGDAKIRCYIQAELAGSFAKEYRVVVEGHCGERSFREEHTLWHTSHIFDFCLTHCMLWWPRNYGQPSLYDVTVSLYRGEQLCDQKKISMGIRTAVLSMSAFTDKEGHGDFCFIVNGKRIFAMGTNWVPLDAFHSRDESRLAPAIEMANDLGCNIIRCWGGNVYESEAFYRACDENGIMVWQDFAMACGIYPREEAFAKSLYQEAVYIVKKLRNHACIVLWSGDNECDSMQEVFAGRTLDPARNFLTREVLRNAVENHDFTTSYLASSPFISKEVFEGKGDMPEMHLWGPRDYFKGTFYKDTFCHFASETGYHGFPSVSSLKRFLAWPEKIWKEDKKTPTDEYLVHSACMECNPDPHTPYAYRIPLANSQVVTLFGEASENLEDFVKQSQISQAEAKKYFIEKFRIGKGKRTGIIWWNLVDGWPQVSDAIVDYYYTKKLAYHYIKRSQAPVCLMFDEPVDGKIKLFGVNDLQKETSVTYKVSHIRVDQEQGDQVTKEMVLSGKALLGADTSLEISSLPIQSGEKEFYLIEWEADGVQGMNHYVTNLIDIDFARYLAAMESCGMDAFEA